MEAYLQYKEVIVLTNNMDMKLNKVRKCAVQELHEKMLQQMKLLNSIKVTSDANHRYFFDILGQKNPINACEMQNNYRNLICAKLRASKIKSLILPNIYADSAKIVEESNKKQELTTMEKLMQSQPAEEKHSLVSDAEVRQHIENETGRDRFNMLFQKGFNNQYHPDLMEIYNNVKLYTFCTFFVAALYGGRLSREKFIAKHKGTKWPTKFLASRAAQDAVLLGGLRQGIIWGTRMAIFSTSFLLVSKSIETYRNKSGVIEYVTAGGVTCAFLRFDLGLKGMFAGGIIGSFLGLCAGVGIYALLNASGENQDSRHYWYITHILETQRGIENLSPKKIESLAEDTSQTVAVVPQS